MSSVRPPHLKRRGRIWWAPGVIVAVLAAYWVYTHLYWADEIEGVVVDAATGAPLAEAIVVSLWTLEKPLHSGTAGVVHIAETTTGSDGRYKLPAWGPKAAWYGAMDKFEPRLNVFKAGYELWSRGDGDGFPETDYSRPLRSDYDGRKIELRSADELSDNTGDVVMDDYILALVLVEPCLWEQIPRYTTEIVKLALSLNQTEGYYFFAGMKCRGLQDLQVALQKYLGGTSR